MERIITILIVVIIYLLLWLNKKTLEKLFLEKETPNLLRILEREEVSEFSSKRVSKGLLILGLSLLSLILNQSVIVCLSWFVLAILIIKWPALVLKQLYQKRLNQLKIEFPIWLRQLQILLQHNTVVQSLRLSQSHAPQLFKVALKDLILQLELSPHDLLLYTSFLQEYQSIEVQRAMKLLYRYNRVGSHDATRQLSRLIHATTKWLRDQRFNQQSTTISLVGWWGLLPLLGVGGLFLVMMVQTIMTLLERR